MIEVKTKIELSKSNVSMILSEYIADRYPLLIVKGVEFNIESECVGYGKNERDIVSFSGVYIECENK